MYIGCLILVITDDAGLWESGNVHPLHCDLNAGLRDLRGLPKHCSIHGTYLAITHKLN
jgi:hypothetical protein